MENDRPRTSRRERKTDRQVCSPATLAEARKLIENGQSKRAVARSLGMAESTLRFRLQQSVCATKLGRFDTTFSQEVENQLCEHLKTLDGMFFGLTPKQLRSAAYEYAEQNNIQHRFNRETKIAGKEWFRGFLKRHPVIALRQPTATSIARAMGFNRPQVDRFYVNLSALMDKYNFPAQSIYNMDETGISTVPNKTPKVLSTKGKRAVNKISSAERGTNVTVVNAVSASGHFIPPAFIFGRKRMRPELLDDAPSGSIGMVSDSSFINADLFLDWLSHFKDHAKPTEDRPILLVLDNHVSHCSLRAIEAYRKNHIVALTLPPHSSHKMQPLDRGFHGVLKKFYSSECEKWLRNHPGRAITVYQMAKIFSPAFYKTATTACGVESFKSTGIFPWNPDVFNDSDFLASSVTDRDISEDEGNSTENNGVIEISESSTGTLATLSSDVAEILPVASPAAISGNSAFLEVSTASKPSSSASQLSRALDVVPPLNITVALVVGNPPCTSTATLPETSTVTSYVTSTVNSVATARPGTFSVQDVMPLPKAETKRASNRRHKKSEIISSSPYKVQIENEIKQKSCSVPNRNNKIKKPIETKKVKDSKQSGPTKKRKIWRCGACGEIYKDPPVEDWIECSKCREWWHEKCTDYIGIRNFICDLCRPN